MAKGQGISINMMILIILGVVVLLIATTLVVKQFKKGDSSIKNASECPENAQYKCQLGCAEDKQEMAYRTCPVIGQVCCSVAAQSPS
jgi:hypothetical protein